MGAAELQYQHTIKHKLGVYRLCLSSNTPPSATLQGEISTPLWSLAHDIKTFPT